MIVTLILSLLIVIFIIGLAISRFYTYYNRRKNESKDLSYSVSRYWRRQFASTSFDSILSSPPVKTNPSRSIPEGNETARIIKSSFSWPEATIIQQQQQQQQQEKAECSSTISSSSLSNSSTMEEIVGSSSLTFALRYNQITHSLFVRIINARDLFVHHRNRQSSLIDSYVRIELLSTETSASQVSLQSMRTHIIKKNAHPIYDELFEFSHVYPMKNFSLLFTILTYDTFTRDEILGQVEFPIIFPDSHITNALESTETIFTKDIIPRYKQLSNQQLGQMLISLCYQPIDSTITLIVLKASNLPRIGTTRLINPYFKIYMYYKSQRIIKKRSTIKRTTQCPVYNECFTFHIPDNDLQNIHFDIILFDYDSHMKHEPIGTFSIGNDNNQHWIDVCHRQITKQIAQWYQLKPFHKLNS
jgi:Ca2+-dependent lipid-binding protein